MPYVILFFLTIFLPAAFWVFFIRRRDWFSPEPKKQFFKAFFLGFIVALLTSLVESLLLEAVFPGSRGVSTTAFLDSISDNIIFLCLFMFCVGAVEELMKYSILREFFYHADDFNQMADGVYYAFIIALGFATIENITYFFSLASQHVYLELVLIMCLRCMFTLLMHMTTTGIAGYALGRQKFSKGNHTWWVRGALLVGIVIHMLFNVLPQVPYGVYIAFFGIVIVFTFLIKYSSSQQENVVWGMIDRRGGQ